MQYGCKCKKPDEAVDEILRRVADSVSRSYIHSSITQSILYEFCVSAKHARRTISSRFSNRIIFQHLTFYPPTSQSSPHHPFNLHLPLLSLSLPNPIPPSNHLCTSHAPDISRDMRLIIQGLFHRSTARSPPGENF